MVGITGRLELLCVWVGGCEVEQASQLASLCSQAEREEGEREGENRRFRPGFAAVSARRAALLGRIVRSSRAGVGGARKGG